MVFVLVLVLGVIFLVADAVMRSTVIRPIFAQHLGESLREGIRPVQAMLIRVVYMGGVVWFAGWSALHDGTPVTALVNGAIPGFVAYGTYELTSWKVMRDWHPDMVAVDMAWGTALTALAAWTGTLQQRHEWSFSGFPAPARGAARQKKETKVTKKVDDPTGGQGHARGKSEKTRR